MILSNIKHDTVMLNLNSDLEHWETCSKMKTRLLILLSFLSAIENIIW